MKEISRFMWDNLFNCRIVSFVEIIIDEYIWDVFITIIISINLKSFHCPLLLHYFTKSVFMLFFYKKKNMT